MIKKTVNKAINRSLVNTKRLVARNNRVKNYLKRTISAVYPFGTDQFTVSILRELAYARHVINNYPDSIELAEQSQTKLKLNPKISLVVPLYNTPRKLLVECIESVMAQSYENWELCLIDDASTDPSVKEVAAKYEKKEKRILFKARTKNGHISAASNDGIAMSTGEFIALLDHDDLLWPNALFEVVKVINRSPKTDFLYSDEDKITEDRKEHKIPFFKPGWNPEFLESVNYITHFAVIRKTIVNEVGGFRSQYNGAQDWDLFLRVSEKTSNIVHIPKVLYSWRITEQSTSSSTSAKPYVVAAQKGALTDHFKRIGQETVVKSGIIKDYWYSQKQIKSKPLVSIVIPTKDQYKVVKRCIESIQLKTKYKNYEIILVDTGSSDQKVSRWYKKINKSVRIYSFIEEKFSYSKSCNFGASKAKGQYLVMLNNDTEVIDGDWIDVLLADAQQGDVGAVGCKLFYPGHTHIQHAGIGIGIGGIAANLLSAVPDGSLTPLQHLYANNRHEVSAVTAACLMVKKSKYDQINGFDELLRVTYNDVDLCLRLKKAGYRNIYNPHTTLIHHESISVGRPEEKKRDTKEIKLATKLFKDRWHDYITDDPHLNPNIDRKSASLELPVELS